MTHDELLEHINKDIDQGGFVSACGEWFPARSLQALRAVVELHKPKIDHYNQDVCSYCSEITFYSEMEEASYLYPCPTIQAIEKELG